MRNRVQVMVREAKKNFYLTVFSNKEDPNSIWKGLRQLGLIRAKEGSLLFPTDELNSFFLSHSTAALNPDAIFLGDESYDDRIFTGKISIIMKFAELSAESNPML